MTDTVDRDDIAAKLRAPIPIDRIEFRVHSIRTNKEHTKAWAILLAYKDARVDMDRLDEVLGPFNWERKSKRIGDTLFCRVGICCPGEERFIWKEDAGVPSRTESEKGEASDAFKRACFNVGIGRELYDYPDMFIQLEEHEWYWNPKANKGSGAAQASYHLRLNQWTWHIKQTVEESGRSRVDELQAVDENGNHRFTYPQARRYQAPTQQAREDLNRGQGRPAQSEQGTRSQPTAWYDNIEADLPEFQRLVDAGTDPKVILNDLRQRFKVNKSDANKILAISKAGDQEGRQVSF